MYKKNDRVEYMGRLCIVDEVEHKEDNEILHLFVTSPMVDTKERWRLEPMDTEITLEISKANKHLVKLIEPEIGALFLYPKQHD